MHVARILGYGAGGAIDASTFGLSALLMIGLVAGNLVGRRIRDRIGERGSHRVTYGVMGAMLLLALAGIR